jgi:hypothetical protein
MANQKPIRVQHPNDKSYVEFHGMSLRQIEVLTAYGKLITFAKKEFELFKKEKNGRTNKK